MRNCPVCGSDDTDVSHSEEHSKKVFMDCYCMECGSEWGEVYGLERVTVTRDGHA